MRRLSTPAHLNWKSFKQGMLVCHQAFFVNRELAINHLYDLQYRFSADFDWCIRIMKKAKCLHNTRLTLIDYLNEGMTTKNHKASLGAFPHHDKALWLDQYNITPLLVCHPAFL